MRSSAAAPRIGLYSLFPSSTFGGGENYLGVTAEAPHDVNGYLWNEPEELVSRTHALTQEGRLRRQMGEAGRQASCRLSRDRFVREIIDAVSPVIEQLRSTAGSRVTV